jgi:hypothetical protein
MKKILATVITAMMLAATPAKASSDLIPILAGVVTGVVVYNVVKDHQEPIVYGHVTHPEPVIYGHRNGRRGHQNYTGPVIHYHNHSYQHTVPSTNYARGHLHPSQRPIYNQYGEVIGHTWAGQR